MQDNYETTDLGLAAALMCIAIHYDEVANRPSPNNPDRKAFVYKNTTTLRAARDAHLSNALQAPTQLMHNNLKLLKAALYNNGNDRTSTSSSK